MEKMIPLTLAAQQLSISWERARRAMLVGRLEGKKRDGHWYVSAASVRRFEHKRQREREVENG